MVGSVMRGENSLIANKTMPIITMARCQYFLRLSRHVTEPCLTATTTGTPSTSLKLCLTGTGGSCTGAGSGVTVGAPTVGSLTLITGDLTMGASGVTTGDLMRPYKNPAK